MYNRLFFFFKNVIKPELLLRFNFNSFYFLPKISHIKVTCVLSNILNENDIALLNSFLFIEFLTLQKPFIKKIFISLKNKKRFFVVVISCNIRRSFLYNFLDYYIHCILPFYRIRQLSLKKKLDLHIKDKIIFTFFLKDMHVFFKMPDRFLSIKCGFNFSIFFKTKNYLSTEIKSFFKILGFF